MVMVTVDVDEFDVLPDISTPILVQELEDRAKEGDRFARKALGGDFLAIERAVEHLRAGRHSEALEALTVGREPYRADVEFSYAAAKRGEHPFLRVGGTH